jgi:acyl-coenzyme A thioesterase PaaI-like protein
MTDVIINGNGTITGLADSAFGSNAVSYLPAGTGAVATTVRSKLRESVSVKDFGAVGNGIADDTAAIQAAIDYVNSLGGGKVSLPAGIFKITSSILLTSRQGIHLTGDGPRATQLKCTSNCPVIAMNGSLSDVVNSTGISNMTIRGNSNILSNSHGISISWTNSCYIHDLVIFGCYNGLDLIHNWQTDIRNIRIYGAGVDKTHVGVYMAESGTPIDNAITAHNISVQNSDYGFVIINGQGSKFVACEAGGSPMINAWKIGNPTGTTLCQWIHLVDCLGDSCSDSAWVFAKGTSSQLSEIQLSNCWAGNSLNGFYINTGKWIVLSACLSIGNTSNGIVLNNCEEIIISSCILRGNNEHASPSSADIILSGGLYNIITGCTCNSNIAGKSIIELNNTDTNSIIGNNLFQGVTLIGLHTQVSRNVAFRTEACGTVDILSGNTSVTVPHSLGCTPPIQAINVTRKTGGGVSTTFWINNLTTTTFDLNVDVAPGVAIGFYWNIANSKIWY